MTLPTSLASDEGTWCKWTEGLRIILRLTHRVHIGRRVPRIFPVGVFSTACVGNHRLFERCASKGDLHFPGRPHGSVDWFRYYDVGFFTRSLALYIERLRSSTLKMFPSVCQGEHDRMSALRLESVFSAGPHYGARCWCTIMPQCVQRRREIYGRGCLLPTPSWTQRVLQVPYQTRLREASDWLLTEQAHGGAWQV